jgi:membrane-associated protein
MIGLLADVTDRVLAWLAGMDAVTMTMLTAAFAALETTALVGLIFPGDLVVLLAGSVADTPQRLAAVLAAAALGTYTGEMIGYAIGRAAGPGLRSSRLGRLLGERRWARAEAYLAGRGARMLVPIRFVSVLHAVAPVVAGTVRMPVRRFAMWSGLGALVWAGTYTAVGATVGSAYREYGHLGLGVTLVLVLPTAVAMVLRRRRRRSATRSVPTTAEQRPSTTEHGEEVLKT